MTMIQMGTKPEKKPEPVPAADVPEIVGFEQRAKAVDEALEAVNELDVDAKKAATSLKDAVELFHREPLVHICLLYTSPSPRDKRQSRMPSSA